MRNEDSENSMFYMFSFITLYPSFTSLVPDDNPSHSLSVITHCERLPARSHADRKAQRCVSSLSPSDKPVGHSTKTTAKQEDLPTKIKSQ